MWIVDDMLLAKGLPTLQNLCSEATTDAEMPYLYAKYDLISFFQAIGDRLHKQGGNPLTRLRNSLAEGLNRYNHLPKFLIIIFDFELLKLAEGKNDLNV